MLFRIGERSDLCAFQNNWDRSDCWNNLNDFVSESKCWGKIYFYSRHFVWGDEFSLNSSYAHWASHV